MQENKFISIQKKILLGGLASLLLAVFTVLFLVLAAYVLYDSTRPKEETADDIPKSYQVMDSVQQKAPYYNAANGGVNNAASMQDDSSDGKLLLEITGGVLLTALFFCLYFWLLTRHYMTYLKELSDGIRGFAKGNLDNRIAVRGEDELSMIASNLNSMADDLKAMMEHDRSVETKKNELVTNVAHDLRTPLTSILGYLGLADREDISEEQRRNYVATAYEKAKRLEKLVEDLFEYSKMSLGAIRMDCQELDLIRILQQLLEEFYPSFSKSGLELEFYYTDKYAFVYADGNLLARAFANLIGNAIKYGSDGKRVEISLRQTAKEVTVQLKNFGEIIPEEALTHIFERFYRVESSRSVQTGGSGLGLTIAKSIVEMHYGTIQVTSDLNGTVFTIVLPKKEDSIHEI